MARDLSKETVIAKIQEAFVSRTCSTEFHDHFNKLSLRVYAPDGRVLFALAPIPLQALQSSVRLDLRLSRAKAIIAKRETRAVALRARSE